MSELRRNLGLTDGIGFSLSSIGPAMAISANVSLSAQTSGRAAPLTFVIGMIAMIIVGLSYATVARKFAHAGSAFAYVGATIKPGLGFLVGWTLVFAYGTFSSASASLAGGSLSAAFRDFGVNIPGLWVFAGAMAIIVSAATAYVSTRFTTRLMLVLQVLAIVPVCGLCVFILLHVRHWSILPFIPDSSVGISGVALGVVAAVLSFAGFESVSTLGEEITDPARNIPVSIMGTVVIVGVFFVFSSYTEVIGFGTDQIGALVSSASPMHDLAGKFGSRRTMEMVDIAIAVSAFGCCLGCLSSGARVLFALGRAGMAPFIGTVDPRFGTPSVATVLMAIPCLAGFLIWGPPGGMQTYFSNVGTIGAIALILVYLGVVTAAIILGMRSNRPGGVSIGFCGGALLVWTFYASLFPVPDFPMNFWPYIVMLWIEAGGVILFMNPRLAAVNFASARLSEAAQ